MPNYVDELMETFKREDEAESVSTESTETTVETETPSTEVEPEQETDKPSEQTETQTETQAEDPPVKPTEPTGDTQHQKEHKPIPEDPVERASFSFKRQLGKTKEKYEKELKERDDKYAKLEAELAELKKGLNKDKPKTRMDFEDDEDFIDYKTQLGVKAAMSEYEQAAAKKEAERIEAEKQAREAREAAEAQHKAWIDNVTTAFGGDKERVDKFVDRVQYCSEKGLGDILDNCPVAADYFLHNPSGPVVFEKILNDRPTFERVFDERRMSPLDIYYELRSVEKELRDAAAASPAPATPAPKPVPHLGRPGKQAGGNSQPDIWTDDDAMRDYIRSNR